MTIHAPMRRTTEAEVDSLPLGRFASVRLAIVLWGGLALLDACRLASAPSNVDLSGLALLVAACCIGMRTGTAVCAAVVGFLLVDGFVLHHDGVLRYDGLPDLARLALLVGVALLATRLRR